MLRVKIAQNSNILFYKIINNDRYKKNNNDFIIGNKMTWFSGEDSIITIRKVPKNLTDERFWRPV